MSGAAPRHLCGHMIKPAQDCLFVRTIDESKKEPCPRCQVLRIQRPEGATLVRGEVLANGDFKADRNSLELDSRVNIVPQEDGTTVIVTIPKSMYPWSIAL